MTTATPTRHPPRPAPEETPPRPRLAYLASMYPAISHTFILREIRALRRLELEIETLSIRRAPAEQLISRDARSEDAATHAFLPVSLGALACAHLRGLARPGAYARTLATALRLAPASLRARAWHVFYFAEAIMLWDELRRRRLDHVHVHFANNAAMVALLAADYDGRRRAASLGWSFTMHGSTEFYDVRAHRLTEKIERARFVACISDFTRSQMQMQVGPEHWDKLAVVHCGLDLDAYDEPPAAERAEAPLRVLFVGRMVEAKGARVLLASLAQLRARGVPIEATLVGDGPDRAAIEAAAARLGVADIARFPGAISQDAIRDYYRAADVFCLPSFAEGIPIVVMEAMAMRRPVVTTPVGAICELVVDGVTGLLVPPGRADALADALARLAADPRLRADLAAAGRAAMRAAFAEEDTARQLAALMARHVGALHGVA